MVLHDVALHDTVPNRAQSTHCCTAIAFPVLSPLCYALTACTCNASASVCAGAQDVCTPSRCRVRSSLVSVFFSLILCSDYVLHSTLYIHSTFPFSCVSCSFSECFCMSYLGYVFNVEKDHGCIPGGYVKAKIKQYRVRYSYCAVCEEVSRKEYKTRKIEGAALIGTEIDC